MRNVWAGLAVVTCTAVLSWAATDQARRPTITGTITRVEKTRLDVKAADGKAITFVLTAKTAFQRGDTTVSPADVKVGERATVEFKTTAQVKTALRVRVGASEKATRYVCPMHPEVVSDKPGKCPKCLMDLEPQARKP